MPWNVSKEDLNQLHKIYNNAHPDSERKDEYIIRGAH